MEVPELVSLLRCAFKLVLDTLRKDSAPYSFTNRNCHIASLLYFKCFLTSALTNAWIMGLEDDYGTVIPLAMVCKRPMELVRAPWDFTPALAIFDYSTTVAFSENDSTRTFPFLLT